METWDISLVLYCQSEEQSQALAVLTKSLGLTATVEAYEPPDPRFAGIRHTVSDQLAAAGEAALQHIVNGRYRDLMRVSGRWECEAESDSGYYHFEGQVDEEDQAAADFDLDDAATPEDEVLARVAEHEGYGEVVLDSPPRDSQWPRDAEGSRGRLAAFLDDPE